MWSYSPAAWEKKNPDPGRARFEKTMINPFLRHHGSSYFKSACGISFLTLESGQSENTQISPIGPNGHIFSVTTSWSQNVIPKVEFQIEMRKSVFLV